MPKKPCFNAKLAPRMRSERDSALVIGQHRSQDRLLIRNSAGTTKVETSIPEAARPLLEPAKGEPAIGEVLHFGMRLAQNKVGNRLTDGEALGETLAGMAIPTAKMILAAAAAAKV